MKGREQLPNREVGDARNYSRDLRPAEWGSGVSLHGSNPEPLMSALGQKRTYAYNT
jgi:hypothetical protein